MKKSMVAARSGVPTAPSDSLIIVIAQRIEEFVTEASVEVERVRARSDLERYPEADLIRYSTLPWFDFTSLSHARDFSHEDSAPRITLRQND